MRLNGIVTKILLALLPLSSFSKPLPLSPRWSCHPDEKTVVCTHAKKNSLLLAIVKEADSWDSIENYRAYLSQKRTITDENGRKIVSTILSATEENWRGIKWVRAAHENSELPGYTTAYAATVAEIDGKKRAVLITLTSEPSTFLEEQNELSQAIRLIDHSHLLSVANDIKTSRSTVQIRPVFQRFLDQAQIPIVDSRRISKEVACAGKLGSVKEQHECALKLVDHFFDALVLTYPERVKSDLNAAYYQGRYTQSHPLLLEEENIFGSVSFAEILGFKIGAQRASPYVAVRNKAYQPIVKVDGQLPPLVRKLILIHEVGVHLGQAIANEMVGEKFRENQAAWLTFTELSAFTVSKDIYDLISYKVFEYDFGLIPIYGGARSSAKASLIKEWKVPKTQTGWIMVSGYNGLNLTMAEADAFEKKYRAAVQSLKPKY